MYFTISLIVLLTIAIIYVVWSARRRTRIQYFIDNAISQSVSKQLLFLAIVTGLAFCFMLLLIRINYGYLKLHLLDWLFAYVNPGSSFSDSNEWDGAVKAWRIITGLVGMVFLSGGLISVISNIIERRVDKVKNGHAHYHYNRHIVIIGFDRMSIGLISQLAEDKHNPNVQIVLQTTQEVPKVRHELFSRLASQIEKRVTIVSGSRTSGEDLEKLQIGRCREVFLLGERDDYDNDSFNIECIRKIHTLLAARPAHKIVRCHVLFNCQSTFAIFQRQDLEHIKDRIDFVPFNYYEMWAQKVFVEGKYHNPEQEGAAGDVIYMPLDHKRITADSDRKVHIVVVGMSKMGVALGIQAAHLCHFPNFVTKGIKTRITFIDEQADREMNFLLGRYRRLFDETDAFYKEIDGSPTATGDLRQVQAMKISPRSAQKTFTDIEFEFIKARVEHPVIQDYLSGLSRDPNVCLTIAVCFYFPPKAIAAGLYMPDEVYDNEIPLLVQQDISHCTLELLTKDGRYRHVKPFGMPDNCYDLFKADDPLPMMVKYLYDNTNENKEAVKSFDSAAIKTCWNDWTDKNTGLELRNITALKWSNIYHANMMRIKQRSLNIIPGKALNNKQINLLARIEHNRWNIEKLLMGYRPCTPEEAADIAAGRTTKKELRDRFIHNDIKPYAALAKDDDGIQASAYDITISKSLPYMLSELEKITNRQTS